jgi:hypothetical protein
VKSFFSSRSGLLTPMCHAEFTRLAPEDCRGLPEDPLAGVPKSQNEKPGGGRSACHNP